MSLKKTENSGDTSPHDEFFAVWRPTGRSCCFFATGFGAPARRAIHAGLLNGETNRSRRWPTRVGNIKDVISFETKLRDERIWENPKAARYLIFVAATGRLGADPRDRQRGHPGHFRINCAGAAMRIRACCDAS